MDIELTMDNGWSDTPTPATLSIDRAELLALVFAGMDSMDAKRLIAKHFTPQASWESTEDGLRLSVYLEATDAPQKDWRLITDIALADFHEIDPRTLTAWIGAYEADLARLKAFAADMQAQGKYDPDDSSEI